MSRFWRSLYCRHCMHSRGERRASRSTRRRPHRPQRASGRGTRGRTCLQSQVTSHKSPATSCRAEHKRGNQKDVVAVQYSGAQCSTAQYSAVQYSTAQHSTAQYSTAQYSTVLYSAVVFQTSDRTPSQGRIQACTASMSDISPPVAGLARVELLSCWCSVATRPPLLSHKSQVTRHTAQRLTDHKSKLGSHRAVTHPAPATGLADFMHVYHHCITSHKRQVTSHKSQARGGRTDLVERPQPVADALLRHTEGRRHCRVRINTNTPTSSPLPPPSPLPTSPSTPTPSARAPSAYPYPPLMLLLPRGRLHPAACRLLGVRPGKTGGSEADSEAGGEAIRN